MRLVQGSACDSDNACGMSELKDIRIVASRSFFRSILVYKLARLEALNGVLQVRLASPLP